MPATKFICPDGKHIHISDCLLSCRLAQRCMLLPTLRAIAKTLNRNLTGFSVTELIGGVREAYLKKTCEYAVNPQARIYALHGSAAHVINERNIDGDILGEERLFGEVCSGQFDLYGALVDDDTATLGDIKVTSSYKIMRAMGMYKVEVPTDEVYKTGVRKGKVKTVKEWRSDGVRNLLDWAIQLNCYRMLLEKQGFPVRQMIIQAICRDNSLRIASERNIRQAVYLIPINRISDRWLIRYLKHKAKLLEVALSKNKPPMYCRARENWHGRKCLEYCEVSTHCDRIFSINGMEELRCQIFPAS